MVVRSTSLLGLKSPKKLSQGDRIAILTPASPVKPEYIAGAARLLEAEGFEPVIMPHAYGPAVGTYAACDADRLADLTAAYADPSIRAILCARGGYGCNHLLPRQRPDGTLAGLDPTLIAADPKWLIGFSDVSALHALSLRAGVISLHAPMAKHLATLGADDPCTRQLLQILRQGLPLTYELPSHPLNRPGTAEGILVGGNLAVINGLADTPFDPLALLDESAQGADSSQGADPAQRAGSTPIILFIEDIAEQIYAVERMLIRLRLAGRLDRLAALIVGQFTDYHPNANHPDMESMISSLFPADPGFPIVFGFPAGHVDHNLPLPLGAHARLTIAPASVRLEVR